MIGILPKTLFAEILSYRMTFNDFTLVLRGVSKRGINAHRNKEELENIFVKEPQFQSESDIKLLKYYQSVYSIKGWYMQSDCEITHRLPNIYKCYFVDTDGIKQGLCIKQQAKCAKNQKTIQYKKQFYKNGLIQGVQIIQKHGKGYRIDKINNVVNSKKHGICSRLFYSGKNLQNISISDYINDVIEGQDLEYHYGDLSSTIVREYSSGYLAYQNDTDYRKSDQKRCYGMYRYVDGCLLYYRKRHQTKKYYSETENFIESQTMRQCNLNGGLIRQIVEYGEDGEKVTLVYDETRKLIEKTISFRAKQQCKLQDLISFPIYHEHLANKSISQYDYTKTKKIKGDLIKVTTWLEIGRYKIKAIRRFSQNKLLYQSQLKHSNDEQYIISQTIKYDKFNNISSIYINHDQIQKQKSLSRIYQLMIIP